MNDIEIIELFFLRSEQAITETKVKYGSLCMKIANAILLNLEDSEECVSSSYLKLWNAIPPKSLSRYADTSVKQSEIPLCLPLKGLADEGTTSNTTSLMK